MKILVLGGVGYIGSHTVYELVDAGEEVVIIDNLETGHREALHPQAKFYQGDLRDKVFVDSVLDQEKDIDAVIHFAANSLVGESMVNPLKYYDNNLCGIKTMLESLVAHGIDKIVFSSTAATYGEPEKLPIMEDDKTEPTNTYGETKLSMEKMFKWVGQAHILAVKYLMEGNESNVFNLGNGIGFTVKEVIETAREVTKKPIKAVEEERCAGDPATLIASSKKAESILGWKPEHADLYEIIASAWKWHSSHPDGYKTK